MAYFVELDEDGLVEGFTTAVDGVALSQTSVSVASFDGIEPKMRWDGHSWQDTTESLALRGEVLAADARKKRDNILADEVDPIITNPIRWQELTAAKQAEWRQYRLNLLAVPQQSGFPHNVTWPTKP